MKLLADKKIPHIQELFADHFTIELFDDTKILPEDLLSAEVLITRSTLKVNSNLLQASNIKVVASPTSGCDHFDTQWLERQGIHWISAPGCNAQSVVEYVTSCIAYLQTKYLLNQQKLRAGVIGAGHVGQGVVDQLLALGFEVIVNDPPRAQHGTDFTSTPLSEFKNLDLLCLHSALTHQGQYPSYHLVDKILLQQQKPGCVLLNAARGAIINTEDLLRYGKHCHWCFDVYEKEPHIDSLLLEHAMIATPHIAGHSKQAKWQASYQIYKAIMNYFNYPQNQPDLYPNKNNGPCKLSNQELLRHYDPYADTLALRQAVADHMDASQGFSAARNSYTRG